MDLSQLHQLVLDSMKEAVYVRDLDKNILYINPASERLTGWSLNEAKGKKCFDVFGDEHKRCRDACPVETAIAEKRHILHQEHSLSSRSGETHDMQASISPISEAEGVSGAVVVMEDITLLKEAENTRAKTLNALQKEIERSNRAEEALRNSEIWLRSIFDSLEEAVLIVTHKRILKDINRAAEKIFGYAKDEVIGSSTEVFHVDHEHCEEFGIRIRNAADRGEAAEFEFEARRKNGEIFPTEHSVSLLKNKNGKPIGMVSVVRDISERKRAEQQREETLSVLKATLDSTADGILVVDRRGEIVSYNRVFAEMWHIPDDIMKSRSDDKALEFALDQLNYPEDFLRKVRELYASPDAESFDVLEFKDGRIFERYSRPQMIGERTVGRVWSFRDVTERRRGEDALRQSEEKYRSVFHNAALGINLKSPDGTFLEVNEALTNLLGYGSEELRRLSYLDITHPEDVPTSRDLHAALERGEADTYRFEKRFVRKDGAVIWVDTSVTALRGFAGDLHTTVGTVADITERKRAEQALRESEDRYRRLFTVCPDGIIVHSEGKCILANHAAVQILGARAASDLVGMSLMSFVHPDYHQIVADRVGNLVRGQDIVPMIEEKLIRLDGQVIDAEVTASALPFASGPTVQVVFRDITERKRAEEELRRQYELQRALLSGIPAYVYFKDKDSVYIAGNRRFSELSGIPEEDIPGKTDYDFFSKEDADSFREDDAQMIATGRAKLNYEVKGTDPEGNTIWFSTSKSPFYGPSGEVAGLVGISIDTTELKRTQELLLQAERFRAVADLAGGVAHNFNNLLQIVIGYLELALTDLDFGNYSQVKNALAKVLESARSGAETVRRLQSFAGIRDHSQAPERGAFDVSAIVRQALDMSKLWWQTIPEKQGIRVDLHNDLQDGCIVQGEKNELFEVAVNLIRNAAEALPQGGTIHVRTHIEEGRVVLEVRDNGVGIDETNLKRLFNPFFTTKAKPGAGLGLASSRKIVEDCGGQIHVESCEGKGTSFTVHLPLAQRRFELHKPPAEASIQGMTILVIDDMEAVLDVLRSGLTRAGHLVVTASSGQQGLDIFNENPVDLVICDLGMPGMNGWEVGKTIRSICKQRQVSKTPFMLLTGWGGQTTQEERIAESGVDAVVEKPIDLTGIQEVIRQIDKKRPPRSS
ncbi:MAG: PAS domain S-box protein [Thermodesulfobacteriota bacterium]